VNVDWSAIAGRAPATVLNVNDHEQNRYLVSKMLRNAGFQVLEAVAGLEAVELARQHRPEVIVLDEPSTALDFSASLHLIETLRRLISAGRTLVWVTHHPGEIPPEIDRVVLLKSGCVHADGRKAEILTKSVLSGLYDVDLNVQWSGGWCDVRLSEVL